MKKHLLALLSFMVLFPAISFAQEPHYLLINFVPESSPGACDASVHVRNSTLTTPLQLWYNTGYRVGNETDIYGLCSGTYIAIEVLDSACMRLRYNFYIEPNPADQVWIDTIMAVMPSTPGASDGTMSFSVIGPPQDVNLLSDNTGSAGEIYTTATSFTSLDQGSYSFMIIDSVVVPADTIYSPTDTMYLGEQLYFDEKLLVDVSFRFTSPDCDHSFDFDAYVVPASPGNCDASISVIPTVGNVNDYAVRMRGWLEGMGIPELNTDGFNYFNYAENICPQPVVVEAFQESGSNAYLYFNRVFFLGVDSSETFSWTPPVIPAGTDSIVLSAVYNCSFDYTTIPDSVYVDTIRYIGGNSYTVTLIVVQGSDEFAVNGTFISDSTGYLFDITMYCPDSVVLRDDMVTYRSVRNLVYYGPESSTPGNVNEVISDYASVYPNPANDKLYINSSTVLKSIEAYSVNGKLAYSTSCNSKKLEINLGDWPPAVYMLKYTDERGLTGITRLVKM